MQQKRGSDRVLGVIPWLPAIVGIGSLAALLVVAAIRLTPWSSKPVALPPPPPPLALPVGPATTEPTPADDVAKPPALPIGQPTAFPVPNAPEGPAANPTAAAPTTNPTNRPTARPSSTPTTRPTTRPTSPAAPSPVTGRYQVNNSFRDSFIGQVTITNAAADSRTWTVTLTFPSGVGGLRTSWVEGQQQPTLRQSGQTYTWTSTVPLAAGASALLRFHYDRPGTAEFPSRCTTNGQACG